MHWRIDYRSGVPVYLQLVEQAQTAIATGLLRDGDQLPTVRALAEELRVNRNTVAKAWAELEAQGLLVNRPGAGCFVTTSAAPLPRAARADRLAVALEALFVQAHQLKLDDATLRALFEDGLRAFARLKAQRKSGS